MDHNMQNGRSRQREISFDATAIGRRLVNEMLREQASGPFRRQRQKERAAATKALVVSPVNIRRARQRRYSLSAAS